jgi:hypothetical protein
MSNEQGTKGPYVIDADGRSISFEDKHQTAADVLRAAGLDPASYDLAMVRGQSDVKTFADDHPITLKTGDEFVSVHVSAPVA